MDQKASDNAAQRDELLSRRGRSPRRSGPPRTEYRSHMWSPVAADGPPGAMFIN